MRNNQKKIKKTNSEKKLYEFRIFSANYSKTKEVCTKSLTDARSTKLRAHCRKTV